MGECVNLAFHAHVIIKGIVVKVVKFRDVPH